MKDREKAYRDKIIGAKFIEFLRKRLILMREILADDGSIYVHLDWKKGHYIKAIMDEVFGEHNFVNEIVWAYSGGGISSEFYPRKHDMILYYKKIISIIWKINLWNIGFANLIYWDFSGIFALLDIFFRFHITNKKRKKNMEMETPDC